MKTKPNILHLTFSVILIFVCALIIIVYGWMFFATFTGRHGLYGNMYSYYQVGSIVFAFYNLIVALIAFFTIIRLFIYLNKEDGKKLTRIFIYFAIFLVILLLSEMYLNTRFVGKG